MFRLILISYLLLKSFSLFSQSINSERIHLIDSNEFIGIVPEETTFNNVLFDSIKAITNLNDCETFDYIFSNLSNSRIILPNSDLILNCPLYLPDNVFIIGQENSSLIFQNCGENSLINCIGVESSLVEFAQSSFKQSHFLIIQNTTLNVGDFVYVIDNDSSNVFSNWAIGSTGQILQIDSIKLDTVFFKESLRRSYISPKVKKLIMKRNIRLENFRIVSENISSSQTANISLKYCTNIFISCIQSSKTNFGHLVLEKCNKGIIQNSIFKSSHSYTNGGKGYGVVLQFATGDIIVQNNLFDSLRHPVLFQAGANGNYIAYNLMKNSRWTDVSLPSNSAGDIVFHGNYPYMNTVEGNVCGQIVLDDSHGKNGPFNTFLRNKMILYGFFMNNNPGSDSTNILINEIINSSFLFGNFILNGNGNYVYGNYINGTCVPLNTENVNLISASNLQPHSFYLNYSVWPPIGYPNVDLGNEILIQFLISNNLNLCQDFILNVYDLDFSNKYLDINLFPNPFTNQLYFYSKVQISKVELLSLSDFVNLSLDFKNIESNTYNLLFKDITPGTYILKFYYENNTVIYKKAIKY